MSAVDPGALLADARDAATLRRHHTDPDVIALTVERARTAIERAMWLGIVLGMTFTTVTVQAFGANGAAVWSLGWLAAWLLAPLVEIPLIAILRGEQILGRYGVTPGRWVRRARWVLLMAAYAMNSWQAWASLVPRDILIHSVPPLAVLLAAEALTDLRDALTRAIAAAATRTTATPRPKTPRTKTADTAPPPPPPGDVRTLREVGVEWAVANWRDDLRPFDIGEALLKMGRDCSKGERSRIRNDAAVIIGERRAAETREPAEVGT